MSLTRLSRRRSFQCMHRYAREAWSEERNKSEFGACFTPHGHGHNYEIEAVFEGTPDKETGMVVNLADVDLLLNSVIRPLEGKHLSLEVQDFKDLMPTTEVLAEWIAKQMIKKMEFKDVRLAKVRLYECEDLWVDVWP